MSEGPTPPPQYAQYPRGMGAYGDADLLQALADGYFGLNTVFIINVVLALGVTYGWGFVLISMFGNSGSPMQNSLEGALYLLGFLAVGLAVGLLTYPKNKRIGEGCGWSPSGPLTASILMGINSALCCGIIGYVIVQQRALREMKNYGIRPGFFGLRKKDVERRIAELRSPNSAGTGG